MKRIGNLTTICALSMACGSSPAAPTPPPPTNIAQTAHQAVRCGRPGAIQIEKAGGKRSALQWRRRFGGL